MLLAVAVASAVAFIQHAWSADAKADAVALFEAFLPQLRALHPDRYDTPEKLQAGWMRFQQDLALAETARKKGYAERPEVRARVAQLLAQELILREAETARPPHSIRESELRGHFEANRHKYDFPTMLGAHELVFEYEPSSLVQREQQLARANDVSRALGSLPVDLRTFRAKAGTPSEAGSIIAKEGDLGVFPVEEHRGHNPPVSKAVVEALLALKEVGRVTGVIDDGRSFRIFRLSAYRPGAPSEFKTVRESIRRELYLQARQRRIEELARDSGWDAGTKLTREELSQLLKPALAAGMLTEMPPAPSGLDIPTVDPPSK